MKKRLIYDKILAQQNSKKISILIGPRQVGKTTILRELHLRLGGIIFDMDIFSNYEKISTYERFMQTAVLNGYKEDQKTFFYVFLDEFQRYADLSRVLKSIYDHHDNIKIYATGSSSLEIKNSVQESLAGRKIITNIYPLSFEEFLYFKDRNDIIEKIKLIPQKTEDYFIGLEDAKRFLEEFLIYGGYPEVVLTEKNEDKQIVLQSIFDLYIKKDFVEYVRMEKLSNASHLIKILAINHGQSANFAKYAGASGISIETTKNYVSILQETFITLSINPFFKNKNKEISKMPKIYFMDNGVRNYFLGNFINIDTRQDVGFLFESFYISELIKKGVQLNDLKYYRTKSGDEVDIIMEIGTMLIPIEIKFKKDLRFRDFGSLNRFIKNFKIKKGYIITTGIIENFGLIEAIDFFNEIKI